MKPLIWGIPEAEYFSRQDWTTQIALNRRGKFRFSRKRIERWYRSSRPFAKRLGDATKAVQGGLQALHHFGGDLVRRRQQVGIIEGVVLEPENIEIDLVAAEQGRQ